MNNVESGGRVGLVSFVKRSQSHCGRVTSSQDRGEGCSVRCHAVHVRMTELGYRELPWMNKYGCYSHSGGDVGGVGEAPQALSLDVHVFVVKILCRAAAATPTGGFCI